MKKMFAVLLTLILVSALSAQTYKESWNLGFGANYPRLVNTSTSGDVINYGLYFSLQRNFSEHTSLRGMVKYNHMDFSYGYNGAESSVDGFAGNFDLIYTFVPCEKISPYLLVGAGALVFQNEAPIDANLEDMTFDFQLNFGFGGELKLSEDWGLAAELDYHVVPSSQFDGDPLSNNTGTAIGGYYDSYMTFNVGATYYFSKGEESKLCQLYDGISDEIPDPVNYDRIEDIVKKYIPKEVVKEVVVEKPVKRSQSDENWVLVGVNFDFGKSKLSPESYPILFHATRTLLANPDMRVEIQGYTDNIGSEKANQKLSEERAKAVKRYLVAKGVDENRLKAVGYGEKNPIADNKTSEGRMMNRRIEFKVLN